jgi:hypothetical protein
LLDEDEDGTCEGDDSPLELDPTPLELGDCGDRLPEMLDEAVCPWNERAARSETAPAKATAPAIIQRLIRLIRASPASRELVSIAAIPLPIIGRTEKKPINEQ